MRPEPQSCASRDSRPGSRCQFTAVSEPAKSVPACSSDHLVMYCLGFGRVLTGPATVETDLWTLE